MNDIRRGKVYALIFIIFLGLLVGGGFFLTKNLTKDKPKKSMPISENSVKEEVNLKLLKDEDYVYFTNEEVISIKNEITFKNIAININSNEARLVETKLNNRSEELHGTFKKISESLLTPEEKDAIVYNEEDVYSVNYVKYGTYTYKDYASILVEDYEYDCINGKKQVGAMSYVFDITTGKLLSKADLLAKYGMTLETLKEKVNSELAKETLTTIDVDGTLSLLEDTEKYALYINKSGHLVLNYLVKNAETYYNDVIVLN